MNAHFRCNEGCKDEYQPWCQRGPPPPFVHPPIPPPIPKPLPLMLQNMRVPPMSVSDRMGYPGHHVPGTPVVGSVGSNGQTIPGKPMFMRGPMGPTGLNMPGGPFPEPMPDPGQMPEMSPYMSDKNVMGKSILESVASKKFEHLVLRCMVRCLVIQV